MKRTGLVAAERASGVAGVGDDLTGLHPLAAAHDDAAGLDVGVPGADAAAVLDAHVVAVVAVRARVVHRAGVRGIDRGAAAVGERLEVRGLLVERCLGGIRGLLRRHHLVLGDLLQTVALVPGDLRLCGQSLRGVARRDGVVVRRLVVLEELVHRAEPRQQLVGVGSRSGEEQLQCGVVAAAAVELGRDLAGLLRSLVGERRLLVGLSLQGVGLGDRGEVGLLGLEELVGRDLGRRLGLRDLALQRLDQPLDPGDLARLGRFIVLRALHVVPARVRRGVRGRDPRSDAEGRERDDTQRADPEGTAATDRLAPQRPPLGRRRRAAALLGRRRRGLLHVPIPHKAPFARCSSSPASGPYRRRRARREKDPAGSRARANAAQHPADSPLRQPRTGRRFPALGRGELFPGWSP
ncbi:unnamed protein product [Penicillium discolor]